MSIISNFHKYVPKIMYPVENYKFHLMISSDDTKAGGAGMVARSLLIGFKSVSGFYEEVEYETIREGGNNSNEIILPTRVKTSNITCEKGVTYDRSLYNWLNDIKDGKYHKRGMILIATGGRVNADYLSGIGMSVPFLSTVEGIVPILKMWSFSGALPVKWEIGNFDATGNDVLIEKLEIAIESIKMIS